MSSTTGSSGGIVRPEEADQEIRELQTHAWSMAAAPSRIHPRRDGHLRYLQNTRDLLEGQWGRLVEELVHLEGRIHTNQEAIAETAEEIDDTRTVLAGPGTRDGSGGRAVSHLTDYGFVWGPAEVERQIEVNGYVQLGVKSAYHRVSVYVSPTGRSVRVWRDGVELK